VCEENTLQKNVTKINKRETIGGLDDSDVDSDLPKVQEPSRSTQFPEPENSAAPSRKLQRGILSPPPPQKNPEEGDTQALTKRS
jgi:hypothetical protein